VSWPEPVERVSSVLRTAAVDARIEQFDEGTPTARDAAKATACELSQIAKTLVFVCDESFVLALVHGDRRADERAVATATGASSVRVANAGEVVRATGFEPGGVAPFPQLEVSQTLIDSSFFAHSVVWIGAGTPRHMASLPPAELARLSGARTFDLGAAG
jgi:prolyl-tRNA editing enzyme YbaK/EbsC (Cys-tRNA(Pro) deacylase)